jgi:hypothetical protein
VVETTSIQGGSHIKIKHILGVAQPFYAVYVHMDQSLLHYCRARSTSGSNIKKKKGGTIVGWPVLFVLLLQEKIVFEHQLNHNTTDTISDHLGIIVTMYGVMWTTMGSMELSCK